MRQLRELGNLRDKVVLRNYLKRWLDKHARNPVQWLTTNVAGRPVIMEAVGEGSFNDFGRISAYTGLPTILGWPGHEEQWRGSREPLGTRPEDVDLAYSTTDVQAALAVLERYQVEFVYVGPLERQRYEAAALEKFGQFMDVAFESEDVTIYQRSGEPVLVPRP